MLCAGVFLRTFKRLSRRGTVPQVLHPAVQPPSDEALAASHAGWRTALGADLAGVLVGKRVFLSINRFERKKVCQASRSVQLHAPRITAFEHEASCCTGYAGGAA